MLDCFSTPQLEPIHRGKVRDSFRVDRQSRLLVATDRISALDLQFANPVPRKGEVLNRLAAFWFERTRDIVANHVLAVVDDQAVVVRECEPIRIEVVVRGALTGSLWRAARAGAATLSGVAVPRGLGENALLPAPLVTPTTKADRDLPLSAADAVEAGLVDAATMARMSEIALALFARGQAFAAERGLILADTKYEFGWCDGELMLIDEIHTPDSSRYWDAASHAADPAQVDSFDKEHVRRWLRAAGAAAGVRPTLPADVVAATSARYQAVFERLTGEPLGPPSPDPRGRLVAHLVAAGILRDGFVAIVMGSRADLPWCERIAREVRRFGVAVDLRVLSAHKNGERIAAAADEYNRAGEPGAVIAVAGLSNGLGGALAANLNLPVINCPPMAKDSDYAVDVHSSLRMPSRAPASTVIGAELAAQAAVRSLGLRRVRDQVDAERLATKAGLVADDAQVRADARLGAAR